ncbi:hypothetical protein QA802_21910 [Streptomyces sp. B21-105]|uniref:SCO2400 family protein n=1 Tax=Streptomyces sp. B21-105 TaxID=3039417 RepID=UPI002FF10AEB
MDYCSSCRRHLNGALVCPGCGAYAPDIAPIPPHGHAVRAGTAGTASPYAPTAPFTPAPFAPAPFARVPERVPDRALDVALGLHAVGDIDIDTDADAGTDVDVVLTGETVSPAVAAVSEAPRGRAARRRQLARWKKNQRRAVVVTAVTLASGLAVAALERQNGDRTQAASAPETPTTAGGEEPTLEHTVPTVTRSDRQLSLPSGTSGSRSRGSGQARQQGTPSGTRPDSAGAPADPAALSAPVSPGNQRDHGSSTYGSTVDTVSGTSGQQSSGSTTPGDSGTSDSTSTSTSASGSGSGSDTGTGTGTGTNSSSPPSSSDSSSSSSSSTSGKGSDTATTSPSDVCLLGLICLS